MRDETALSALCGAKSFFGYASSFAWGLVAAQGRRRVCGSLNTPGSLCLLDSRLHVTFIDKDGDEYKIAVSKGDNLLDVAQANDIEMEGKHKSFKCCQSLLI
jgi:hypothetical protein